ncbi:MAG: hypothetical protein HY719_15875 [Planctomycetes bacterium]|nr:hypothetical protein [Planctomycetota bacterium]
MTHGAEMDTVNPRTLVRRRRAAPWLLLLFCAAGCGGTREGAGDGGNGAAAVAGTNAAGATSGAATPVEDPDLALANAYLDLRQKAARGLDEEMREDERRIQGELSADRGSPYWKCMLGLFKLATRRVDEAEIIFKGVAEQEGTRPGFLHWAWFGQASIAMERRQVAEAEALLARATQARRDFALGWVFQAGLLRRRAEPRKAEEALEKAMAAAAGRSGRARADVYRLVAEVLVAFDWSDKAVELVKSARARAADADQLYELSMMEAQVLSAVEGDLDAYRTLLRKTAESAPARPEAWELLGAFSLKNDRDFESAAAAYEAMLAADPTLFSRRRGDTWRWSYLAVCYKELLDGPRLVAFLDKVTAQDPGHPDRRAIADLREAWAGLPRGQKPGAEVDERLAFGRARDPGVADGDRYEALFSVYQRHQNNPKDPGAALSTTFANALAVAGDPAVPERTRIAALRIPELYNRDARETLPSLVKLLGVEASREGASPRLVANLISVARIVAAGDRAARAEQAKVLLAALDFAQRVPDPGDARDLFWQATSFLADLYPEKRLPSGDIATPAEQKKIAEQWRAAVAES